MPSWFISLLAALAMSLPLTPAGAGEGAALAIGTTPVFLDDQIGFLQRWEAYLRQHLGQPIRFVQRASYRDIVQALKAGRIDFAWICGYPYVREEKTLRLVAVPVYQGQPLYRSYLIVPAADTATRHIFDLRGRIFAYSDPLSNSGWLYPQTQLRTAGEEPARFFARSFFTLSHRKVVDAVASGFADGGAVDGYVYDTLVRRHPELAQRTRVADRSPPFGFPPIVAAAHVDATTRLRLQSVLVNMRDDPEGRRLLAELNLDGFVAGEPGLFDGIRKNWQRVGRP
jgi:phosphonate transport system substrate-binding protein